MSIFRRARPAQLTGAAASLAALSDADLGVRYQGVDRSASGGHPPARARELDDLVAELLRRYPDEAGLWYDRGMFAKWRRDWPLSIDCNRAALDRLPAGERDGAPAAWNLGIAATAARDWKSARMAWAAFGLQMPVGPRSGAPIVADFGLAPVRLNPEPRFVGEFELVLDGRHWDPEVVWGRRLCPARIRIENVPTPESGHRFGDIVLHDGDPVGTRQLGGQEAGVFNEIELWERAAQPTLTASVSADAAADLDELDELMRAAGGAAEDWTQNVQVLCRACSEGSPHPADHQHDVDRSWTSPRAVGLAGTPERVHEILTGWAHGGSGRSFSDLDLYESPGVVGFGVIYGVAC